MILFFWPETRVSDQRLHHSTTRQQTTLTTKTDVASSITIEKPSPIEISEPLSHAALRLPCLACGRSHQRSSCQVAAASTQLLATSPHCCTTILCPFLLCAVQLEPWCGRSSALPQHFLGSAVHLGAANAAANKQIASDSFLFIQTTR